MHFTVALLTVLASPRVDVLLLWPTCRNETSLSLHVLYSWNLTTKDIAAKSFRPVHKVRNLAFFASCCIIYSSMRQIRKDHGVGGREEESALHLIQDALLV